MGAQCGRAAQADIAQHLPLLVRQCRTPVLKELMLMGMEDIGHFEPMPTHVVLFPPWAVRVSTIVVDGVAPAPRQGPVQK
jgi:hypothetical protein